MASLPNLHGSHTILQVWLVSHELLYSAPVMHCHCISLQRKPELAWYGEGNRVITMGNACFLRTNGTFCHLLDCSFVFGFLTDLGNTEGTLCETEETMLEGEMLIWRGRSSDKHTARVWHAQVEYSFSIFHLIVLVLCKNDSLNLIFLKLSFQGGGPGCFFSSGYVVFGARLLGWTWAWANPVGCEGRTLPVATPLASSFPKPGV